MAVAEEPTAILGGGLGGDGRLQRRVDVLFRPRGCNTSSLMVPDEIEDALCSWLQ